MVFTEGPDPGSAILSMHYSNKAFLHHVMLFFSSVLTLCTSGTYSVFYYFILIGQVEIKVEFFVCF